MSVQNPAVPDGASATCEQGVIDGITPAERIGGLTRWDVILGRLSGLMLVVDQLFNLQAFGSVPSVGWFLYLLGGVVIRVIQFGAVLQRTGGGPFSMIWPCPMARVFCWG